MAEKGLHYEDVNEGDEAPVKAHTLTRTDLVRYAGASGDYNPMHHDETIATSSGQPSVFGHGMFSMGCWARLSPTTWEPAASLITRCVSRARRGPARS